MPNQQPNLNQQQKPKFNLKYILIVLILATLVGGGILAYQYWWLPKQEVKPPELTIKNDIADWKTYRNEEYGFEVKYPDDWSVRNASIEEAAYGKVAFFRSPEVEKWINEKKIVIYENLEISFWKNINNNIGGSYPGQRSYSGLSDFLTDERHIIQKTGEINIDNHKAYEVIIGGAGDNYGVMIENNGIYELLFGLAYNRSLDSTEKEILSTFKFIK